MKYVLFASVLIIAGCASLPDPNELVYIGTLSYDCNEISNPHSIVTRPVNFKITPIEAAEVLKSKSRYGCMIKMGFNVYADESYYYVANNNQLALVEKTKSTIQASSFVVNGVTGELVSIPTYEE